MFLCLCAHAHVFRCPRLQVRAVQVWGTGKVALLGFSNLNALGWGWPSLCVCVCVCVCVCGEFRL